ncbi:uncharacterized protein CG5098 [Diaphorina citri]|uniref:Uncharacterized protein CG5098 n=1 Tax=Diaphorina citri TaxID=121845 RepID=A0A3Q0JLA4_DIACI|nr:uncharacterized protein CG5098 [Diaphorina citri]
MSPNVFHNNVKLSCGNQDSSLVLQSDGGKLHGTSVDSTDNPSVSSNDQPDSMEQNNVTNNHKMLRNNLKAENLKSKIDLLIMSKTKVSSVTPGEEEAEENIQSIQEEIDNMLTGKMGGGRGVSTTPVVDLKNSNKTKIPMNPTKVEGPKYGLNNHNTVENVEHLLETMFQDSKQSPAKLNTTVAAADSKHSNKKGTPRNSLDKLSNEAIENILRTPSPIDELEEDVKSSVRSNSKFTKTNPHTASIPSQPDSTHNLPNNNSTNQLPSHLGQTTRSGRLRKRSTLSSLESHDDSSNDSTKLEIIDDLNRSSENLTDSLTSEKSSIRGEGSVNHQGDGVKSGGTQASNGLTKNSVLAPASDKDSKELHIKQEPQSAPSNQSRDPSNHSRVTNKSDPGNQSALTKSPGVKNTIIAVESELEKMFAGIVKEEEEEDESQTKVPPSVKKENGEIELNSRDEKPIVSGGGGSGNTRNSRRRSSEFFASSPEPSCTPPKKKKKSKAAAAAAKLKKKSANVRPALSAKDTSNDSIGRPAAKVSPFVRLYADSKEAVVINSVANIRDEEVTGATSVVKKPASFVPKTFNICRRRLNQTDSGAYQVNVQPVAILHQKRSISVDVDSTKLTAGLTRVCPDQNSDSTSNTPYSTSSHSTSKCTTSPGVCPDQNSDSTSNTTYSTSSHSTSKCTTSGNTSSGTIGGKVSTSGGSSKHHPVEYEVWFHEPCLAWGSGVYMVGSSLMGLDQCVWSALNSTCVNCGETGASIGCVRSKCRGSVHYSCALHIGWYLDPTTFIATCSAHRDKYDAQRYLETPGGL